MPGTTLPPFPDDVPVCPLIVIDYALLEAGDEAEGKSLWKAATEIGFWYLKNHGLDDDVNRMYDMGAETIELPLEEKMKFDQGDAGMSFGYKAAGVWDTDGTGVPDNTEFLNISKDDAYAYPEQVHRAYPGTVNARMENTIVPFMKKSVVVNNKMLDILGDLLGFPKGTMLDCHREDQQSGTESRCIRNPPRPDRKNKSSLGAHTDFGSITLLHNRLGGLQVLVPGTDSWEYVKPYPGYAICNLGDAMPIFSGGLLHSNLHRVIAPPGEQALVPRWSLAFLSRPNNDVPLRALTELSPIVKEAAAANPEKDFETGSTAGEWFARRVKYHRLSNLKTPDAWAASRGTEHVPVY